MNLDAPGSDEVRAYLVDSALAWLRDFRLERASPDAVHALRDTRAVHFLEELSTAVDALADDLGRPLFLIAESDLNRPAARHRARGGRAPGTARAVERPLPPRAAHRADR